jgi:hypothetical protein
VFVGVLVDGLMVTAIDAVTRSHVLALVQAYASRHPTELAAAGT